MQLIYDIDHDLHKTIISKILGLWMASVRHSQLFLDVHCPWRKDSSTMN